MDVDIFTEIVVPVIGGLGLFLLGLDFMEKGIQALSANKMRQFLAKLAGSPGKGVAAGAIITGVIQSSTAMTVMTVGLVNAGVLTLRGAIGVVMGANIGTTLGNGLIALPLGPLGLLFGGFFATVYCFAKSDRWRNVALTCLGFSIIFYGLNLLTGGLKPLRNMPAVMDVISSLSADTVINVVMCALVAALITALIHSSSATIGIVMGLGAAGILEWQVAIAFAIGADLGTTITSWIASIGMSRNAKRTAYAHIMFNFIGVCVVLVLFFPAIAVLSWAMGLFGADPSSPVLVDGTETYPLVPVAVGVFSIFFNIFNVLLLFPFVKSFERLLLRIGRSKEDTEDYSVPKYLDRKALDNFNLAVPAMQQETRRALLASTLFIDIARGREDIHMEPADHYQAVDALSREIRAYSAHLFHQDLSREQMDLVASMIEEVDFTGSLSETLNQIARRVQRESFSPTGSALLDQGLQRLENGVNAITSPIGGVRTPSGHSRAASFENIRWAIIDEARVPAEEKGALLALLGSIERAEALIDRIAEERESVDRGTAELIPVGSAGDGAADPRDERTNPLVN